MSVGNTSSNQPKINTNPLETDYVKKNIDPATRSLFKMEEILVNLLKNDGHNYENKTKVVISATIVSNQIDYSTGSQDVKVVNKNLTFKESKGKSNFNEIHSFISKFFNSLRSDELREQNSITIDTQIYTIENDKEYQGDHVVQFASRGSEKWTIETTEDLNVTIKKKVLDVLIKNSAKIAS